MNEAPASLPTMEGTDRYITPSAERRGSGRLMRASAVACVLLAVGFAVLTGVYDLHRLRSGTMLPTLPVGGVGAYQPVASTLEIERGDIVRFDSDWPDAEGFPEITFRVIALGGDRVEGERNGNVSVNGKQLDEPYVDSTSTAVQPEFAVDVPEGRLFLAGDGRSMAFDSRLRVQDEFQGTVSTESVSGRLVGVAWPVWQWSAPESGRGTPWPFVGASLLIGVGALLGIGCLFQWLTRTVRTLRLSISRMRS